MTTNSDPNHESLMITAHDARVRSRARQLKIAEDAILLAITTGCTRVVLHPNEYLIDWLAEQLRDGGFEVSRLHGRWLEVKWDADANELERAALDKAYHGNALYVAKSHPVAEQTPTPEQLREDAGYATSIVAMIERSGAAPELDRDDVLWLTRAALALEEQAARLEAPAAELRGWGVMRSDGTLCPWFDEDGAVSDGYATHAEGYRAVPVRLIADSAAAQDTPSTEGEG